MLSLCGIVILTPLIPNVLTAWTAFPISSGDISNATYTQSSPRAEKALLCIAGERL